MKITLRNEVKYLFLLGAGASIDYGLPGWKDLGILIREKINNDKENRYRYKKEVLAWIDKVGEHNEYATIDECIKHESISKEYHLNGPEIENQIFILLQDIFNDSYRENDEGWIRILNEKILHSRNSTLEKKISFINYNYDNVLSRNFLNFSHLPEKHRRYNYKEILNQLSSIIIETLHPHGYLFPEEESTHIYRLKKTMKSNDMEHLDVVSCYESQPHYIDSSIRKSVDLYILGLGGGLKVNLENLLFDNFISVSEIHITVKDPALKSDLLNFLSEKFNIPITEIKVYTTCKELVQKTLND